MVPDAVAAERRARRSADQPTRRAHADAHPVVSPTAFRRLSMDAPQIEVDTADGYAPGLDELAAFVTS